MPVTESHCEFRNSALPVGRSWECPFNSKFTNRADVWLEALTARCTDWLAGWLMASCKVTLTLTLTLTSVFAAAAPFTRTKAHTNHKRSQLVSIGSELNCRELWIMKGTQTQQCNTLLNVRECKLWGEGRSVTAQAVSVFTERKWNCRQVQLEMI